MSKETTSTEDVLERHSEEWTKLSSTYLEQAVVKNNSDPLFYRHRCIEGLLTGTTNDYK